MVFGLAAIMGSLAGAAPPETMILQPVSAWGMNYAEDSCELSRTFGHGGDEVTVAFRQFGPGTTFTLLVAGQRLRSPARPGGLLTDFEPGGRRFEDDSTLAGTLPDGRGVLEVVTSIVPPDQQRVAGGKPKTAAFSFEKEAAPIVYDRGLERKVTSLRLSGPIASDIVLELGPMDGPMDAMRACTDELLTHWGVDAAAQRTLQRRAAPRNYPGAWVAPNDYPTNMLRAARSAAVHFRVMIDSTGTPTKCVVQSPGDAEFDKVTCDLIMRRARFDPALDAAGKPIASYYVSSVRWYVPR